MCGTKNFAKSLTELVNDVDSTIPHAKQNGYPAISADMSLDVAQGLVGAVKSYKLTKKAKRWKLKPFLMVLLLS